MKRIGFSHNYTKLHGTTRARLVEWQSVDTNYIDEAAIFYDTEYWENNERKFYDLKPGVYLRLLLMSECGIPFTTYRKANDENAAKYCDAVGEWFEIYVKEGGAKMASDITELANVLDALRHMADALPYGIFLSKGQYHYIADSLEYAIKEYLDKQEKENKLTKEGGAK